MRNSFEILRDDGCKSGLLVLSFDLLNARRFNETGRLRERYVKFRPTELQRIAGEVIQQDHCPDISKLAEGGFNKVFFLRAKDGRELIARIPTPIAGLPR